MIHFPLCRKCFLFAKLFYFPPPWLQWKTRITFPVCVTTWSKQNSKIKSKLLQSHDFVVRCKIWRSKNLGERHLMFFECSCCIAEEGKRKTKFPYFEIMMKTVCLRCWHLIDLNSSSKELVFPSRKLKGIIAKHFLQHFSHFTEIWKGQRWKQNLLQEFTSACFFYQKTILFEFIHASFSFYEKTILWSFILFMRSGFFYQSVPFFAKSLRIR